jgi:hypothetical protein
MIRRLISTLMLLACLIISPLAHAEGEEVDARMLGFRKMDENRPSVVRVTTGRPGAGLAWFAAFFVIIVASAGMFKNSRRTHLD